MNIETRLKKLESGPQVQCYYTNGATGQVQMSTAVKMFENGKAWKIERVLTESERRAIGDPMLNAADELDAYFRKRKEGVVKNGNFNE